MLDLRVDVDDQKVTMFLDGIDEVSTAAIKKGLRRVGIGVFRRADALLAGGGAKVGSYPVPTRNDNLKSKLNWLAPGQSFSEGNATFEAGDLEIIIFNSAPYGDVIHDGTHTSEEYGPREYLTDAFTQFNEGNRFETIIDSEIQKSLDARAS